MNVVKSRKDADLLIKGITETVENEVKEQKRGFFKFAATLGAS